VIALRRYYQIEAAISWADFDSEFDQLLNFIDDAPKGRPDGCLRHLGAVIVLSAVALTGLGFAHPFCDPRVEPSKGLDTLLRDANMPADAKRILNEVRPLPLERDALAGLCTAAAGSWLIERDIVEARKKMNLSTWDRS
jgi:hypothetical protein